MKANAERQIKEDSKRERGERERGEREGEREREREREGEGGRERDKPQNEMETTGRQLSGRTNIDSEGKRQIYRELEAT